MSTSEMKDWAEALAESKSVVIHATGVVGRVVGFYTPETWGGPNKVDCNVLTLDTGDSFVARDRRDFVVLDQQAADFAVAAFEAVRSISDTLVKLALQGSTPGVSVTGFNAAALRALSLVLAREARKVGVVARHAAESAR